MTAPSPQHCSLIVPLLWKRDGRPTQVELSGDRTLTVWNIAWGEDMGDDFEHVTTNFSPEVEGTTVDLFFTDEVLRVTDAKSGEILWSTYGVPNLR